MSKEQSKNWFQRLPWARKFLLVTSVVFVSAAVALWALPQASELYDARHAFCETYDLAPGEEACTPEPAGSEESRFITIGIIAILIFAISALGSMLMLIGRFIAQTFELSTLSKRMKK